MRPCRKGMRPEPVCRSRYNFFLFEVIQHTPHHESRRKASVSNTTVEDQMTIHAGVQGVKGCWTSETGPTQTYSVSGEPELRVPSAREGPKR